MTVELLNGPEIAARLNVLEGRLLAPLAEVQALERAMEAEEEQFFAAGKYVRTGALRASLTSGGSGAIRRLTPTSFEFGTSVWYAGYQGTTGKGRHRPPSAILRLTPTERALAPKLVMDRIVSETP